MVNENEDDIKSWEIFKKIEADKEIIRNSLNIFPTIQPFE